MKQDFKQTVNQETDQEDLVGQYNTVKAKVATRFVILKASSCCGCGCSDVKIRREVPLDSPLKKGDYVGSDIKSTDEIL